MRNKYLYGEKETKNRPQKQWVAYYRTETMQYDEKKDNARKVTDKNLNLNLQIDCSNWQHTSKPTLDPKEAFLRGNNTWH